MINNIDYFINQICSRNLMKFAQNIFNNTMTFKKWTDAYANDGISDTSFVIPGSTLDIIYRRTESTLYKRFL